jgi:hypothetical protein
MTASSQNANYTPGRCLACSDAPPPSLQSSDAPCPYCGSIVEILETTRGLAAIVKPPRDFHTSLTPPNIFASLPSNIGRCFALVVDLSGAPLLTSSAIGEILVLQKRLDAIGKQLKLAVDMPTVRERLHTLHLDRFLSIHGSPREALESP